MKTKKNSESFFFLMANIVLVPALLFCAVACDENIEPPATNLIEGAPISTIVMPDAYAQDTIITFTTKAVWSIKEEKKIVSFSPDGGEAGKQSVKISVKANPTQKVDSTRITIVSGAETVSFYLKRAPQPVHSFNDITLLSSNDQTTIAFEATQEWSATASVDWIILEKITKRAASIQGEAGIQQLKISAQDNILVPERKGEVTIKIGNTQEKIVVTQEGVVPFIKTSITEINLTPNTTNEYRHEYIKVEDSNITWELLPQPSENKWFKQSLSVESKEITISFSLQNDFHWPVYPLEGAVVLKDKLSDYTYTVPVRFSGWGFIVNYNDIWNHVFSADKSYRMGDKLIVNIEKIDGENLFKGYAIALDADMLLTKTTATWAKARKAEDQTSATPGTENWEIYVDALNTGVTRSLRFFFIPYTMSGADFKENPAESIYWGPVITQERGADSQFKIINNGQAVTEITIPAEGGTFEFDYVNTDQNFDLGHTVNSLWITEFDMNYETKRVKIVVKANTETNLRANTVIIRKYLVNERTEEIGSVTIKQEGAVSSSK